METNNVKLSLNSIIGELETTIGDLLGRYLFILLDARGGILKVFQNNQGAYDLAIQYFKEQKNIFDCFLIPGQGNLSQAVSGKTLEGYPIKSNIHEALGNGTFFFTNIPLWNLQIVPARPGLYLGIIKPVEIMSFGFHSKSNGTFFVDGNDIIKVADNNFCNLFSKSHPKPENILDLNLEEFLEPTLKQRQEAYFQSLPPANPRFPHVLFEMAGLREEKLRHYPHSGLSLSRERWRWANAADTNDFIQFLEPFDTGANDFHLEVSFKQIKGNTPLLMVGRQYEAPGETPDNNGYLAGPSPDGVFMLKRWGTLVAETKAKTSSPSSFALVKKGRSLTFFVNGSPEIRFFDQEFSCNIDALFALGLRPGGETEIEDLFLRYGPSIEPAPYTATETVVKSKTVPPRYFSLTRINPLTYQKPVQGYILNDVTALNEKVNLFQESYELEKKKRETLSNVLKEYQSVHSGFPDKLFVGSGAQIQSIKEKAKIAATSSASVLIMGPTGTGKEMLAHYIHQNSRRNDKAFVKVDCSTLPRDLVESELFGFEKGAFTGAQAMKIGRIEQANEGTLFLDEISNLDLTMQSKLLSVLQDMVITRVGGTRPIKLDIRLLCASNVPLRDLIEKGLFREDLFHRLNTITLELPALAKRTEDIPELCKAFLETFNLINEKSIQGLTPGAFAKLSGYSWPGNIRELKNVIQNAVIFCDKNQIDETMIKLPSHPGEAPRSSVPAKKEILRTLLIKKVRECKGNIMQAARSLGVSRQTCYFYLAKYGIDPVKYRK